MNLMERIRSKITGMDVPADICWEWTGSLNTSGYPTVNFCGGVHLAHRLVWEGDHDKVIPEDMCVMQSCSNNTCLNPRHLFLGTKTDVAQRRLKLGNHNFASRTTCAKAGHEYTNKNTRWYCGERKCRECEKERELTRPKRNRKRAA